MISRAGWGAIAVLLLCVWGVSLKAQQVSPTTGYTLYGTPGLIDMPTALSAEDAELATSISDFAGTSKLALTFQITPRLSGTFRYTRIENYLPGGVTNYDRSFDLHYRFLDEGRYRPAVAVGLRDFVGTGIYSGEYVVATKHVTPRVAVTGGIGWGRLASYDGFTNPLGALDSGFETRPGRSAGDQGGNVQFDQWFRGDAAFFGGISWAATDRVRLKAEYSSDAYTRETGSGDLFDRDSPWNFGVEYDISPQIMAQAAFMHGDAVGVGLTFRNNPRKAAPLTLSAPSPVRLRDRGEVNDVAWATDPDSAPVIRENLENLLPREGVQLEAVRVGPRVATVHIRNTTYQAGPIAIGRTARIMSRVMPASVDTFEIVPMERGIPTAKVVLARDDVEALETAPDGAQRIYDRARFEDASDAMEGAVYAEGLYPRFRWGLGPYLRVSYFDPDNPIRADLGLELNFGYDLAPGLVLNGSVQKRIIGNLDGNTRFESSNLPRVRSDANIYDQDGDPAIPDLTVSWYSRPGTNLFGRVSAGYLERMYGGLSAELLWKRVDSPFALGVEVNRVRQRDFDQLFGFQDYEVTTGHVSAYYDFGNGFHGQVDAGRYLAGDWGTTLTLDRVFANGWRVGAYATFTDVSAEDFGEGSFDKGLRLTIPMEAVFGTPSRRKTETVIQSLSRDGGARLRVSDRLYETVRGYHKSDLGKSWGRFWQ